MRGTRDFFDRFLRPIEVHSSVKISRTHSSTRMLAFPRNLAAPPCLPRFDKISFDVISLAGASRDVSNADEPL